MSNQKPTVQQSSMAGPEESKAVNASKEETPTKPAPKKKPVNLNDSLANDSVSRGGGVAGKMALAMSRIAKAGDRTEDDDEVRDLRNLIEELNSNNDLTEKLTNQSKISIFLGSAGNRNASGDKKTEYKEKVNAAKNQLGSLQSKLRLDMKSMLFDPRVK